MHNSSGKRREILKCIIYIYYRACTWAAFLIFRGLLPTVTSFLPSDVSRRFRSRSGYLAKISLNKLPMFPLTLLSVVYGVISSSTQAINFLTICPRFYEPVGSGIPAGCTQPGPEALQSLGHHLPQHRQHPTPFHKLETMKDTSFYPVHAFFPHLGRV